MTEARLAKRDSFRVFGFKVLCLTKNELVNMKVVKETT